MDQEAIRNTRRLLQGVNHWIEAADYENSRNHYGCPRRAYPLLDLPLNEEPTYTDVLVEAGRVLGPPLHYLELGVSVGKNFFVMANTLQASELVGFDLEPINPVLEHHFSKLSRHGPLQSYRCRDNGIEYLQGDILDKNAWQRLQGKRFNLIFSDACHQPHAVLFEYHMLERYDLIDPGRFLLLWDDLDRSRDGPLTQAFYQIFERMQQRFGLSGDAAFRLELNGWLGQHEHRHVVGIITNIGLTHDVLALPPP